VKFTKRENTTSASINEWTSPNFVVAELAFMFGQHRVQIWHGPHEDVVLPNF